MNLKIIILFFVALTLTQACDLDWILEDVYDDIDSSEDESTEKPANNQNNASSSTAASPPENTSINTKPFPIIPTVVDNSSANNSAPSNKSSRAIEEKSKGKGRHRITHHRRRVLRKIPIKDDKAITNEGRGFTPDFDQISLFARFAPMARKSVVQENRSIKDLRSAEIKNEHSFVDKDFIELLEGRNLDSKKQMEVEDFIKTFLARLETKDVDKEFEIPQGRMEDFEDDKEKEVDNTTEEEDELFRSFTDDDSLDDGEAPKSRMETYGFKRNMKKDDDNPFMKFLMRRSERKNLRKRVRPSPDHISKSDLKKYMKEYIKMLILRDIEEKIGGSDDFVYVPIPKSVLKQHIHNSPLQKNHQPFHKHSESDPAENLSSPLIEALLSSSKPSKTKPSTNEENESFLLLISKGPSKKPEKDSESNTQSQNKPHMSILNPSDSDIHRLVDESPPEIKFPNINHVNHVKEHILRETIKIDPKDNSQIHNVHEQTRLSIIKSPQVAVDLTLEKNDPADLDGMSSQDVKKPEMHPIPSNLFVEQMPPKNTKNVDFHQKLPGNYQEHSKSQQLLHQELPFVLTEKPFKHTYANHMLMNRFGEDNTSNPMEETKLSDIYMQAQSYPINYPINKHSVELKPESSNIQTGKAAQEENFYVKPQILEKDQPQLNSEQLPLVDMIDKFKGQDLEKPMQEQGSRPAVPTSFPPLRHDVAV